MSLFTGKIESLYNNLVLNLNHTASADYSSINMKRYQLDTDVAAGDIVNDGTGPTDSGTVYNPWPRMEIFEINSSANTNKIGAIVNGTPAAVSTNGTTDALYFSRCSSPAGIGPWTTNIVDSGITFSYLALAVVAGYPAVSYYDQTNTALKFAINSAVDGSGSWTVYNVDVPLTVGSYTSLADIGGFPGISYYDSTNTALKYATNSAANGSGTWSLYTVESASNVGQYTSLALVNGKPAISYYYVTSLDIKFAINSLADGSGTWNIANVYTTGSAGPPSSLAVVNGVPAIALGDETSFVIRFARNSLATGLGTWTVTSTTLSWAADLISLAVVNGFPALAYRNTIGTNIQYAVNSNASGTGTWTNQTVATSGAGGSLDVGITVLELPNLNPAIIYPNSNSGTMMIASYNPVATYVPSTLISSADDYYTGMWMRIGSMARQITDYVSSTNTFTFSSAWTGGDPANNTSFDLYQNSYISTYWDEVNDVMVVSGVPKIDTAIIPPHVYQPLQVGILTANTVNVGSNTTVVGENYNVIGGKTNTLTVGTSSSTYYNHLLIKDVMLHAMTFYTASAEAVSTISASSIASGSLLLTNGAAYTLDSTANLATEFGIISSTFSTLDNIRIIFRVRLRLPLNGNTATVTLGTGQQWTNRTASSTVTVTSAAEFIFKFTSITAMLITVLD